MNSAHQGPATAALRGTKRAASNLDNVGRSAAAPASRAVKGGPAFEEHSQQPSHQNQQPQQQGSKRGGQRSGQRSAATNNTGTDGGDAASMDLCNLALGTRIGVFWNDDRAWYRVGVDTARGGNLLALENMYLLF